MDLSTIEGLTAEQLEAIKAEHNKSIEGLKNKNEQLLGETKSAKANAGDLERLAQERELALIQANEEKLKKENDFEGYKAHFQNQLAEQKAVAAEAIKQAQDSLTKRDYATVKSDMLTLFHDSHKLFGDAFLAKGLNIGYNDQQQPLTEFKFDGEVVASNLDEFKSWAREHPVLKQYLKGVESSGAGATRTGGASGQPMTLTEKAIAMNKNPNAQF